MQIKKTGIYKYSMATILCIAIIIRVILFLQNPSLWLDESYLALNIQYGSYLDLFKGLENLQACPVGFTLCTKALVDMFNPQTDFYRDLLFRVIPLFSGIAVLLLFSKLLTRISGNLRFRIIALAIVAFSPLAINYCTQLKQYSTEMLLTVVLMTVFYDVIFRNKNKHFYPYLIAIVPWFSYSSFFIILSYLIIYLCKNFKRALLFSIPFLLSVSLYYIISLKYVFNLNYSNMVSAWMQFTAFLNWYQPIRFIQRLGESLISVPIKFLVLMSGTFILYFIFVVLCKKYDKNLKNDILYKMFYLGPLLLTIIASLLHKYPFAQRLTLFLLPYYAIFVATVTTELSKKIQVIFLLLISLSLPFYQRYDPDINYSYARDIINYVSDNSIEGDLILTDNLSEYIFYYKTRKLDIPIKRLPFWCMYESGERFCQDYIKKSLEPGKYYFLTYSYTAEKIIADVGFDYKQLPIKHKKNKTKAVYFIKE